MAVTSFELRNGKCYTGLGMQHQQTFGNTNTNIGVHSFSLGALDISEKKPINKNIEVS